MTLRLRKIIAREFLILLLCILISGVSFVVILFYNSHLLSQQKEIESEISAKKNISDSLTKAYKLKISNQQRFFNSLASWQYEKSVITNKRTANHAQEAPSDIAARLFNSTSTRYSIPSAEELARGIGLSPNPTLAIDTSIWKILDSLSVNNSLEKASKLISEFPSKINELNFSSINDFSDFIIKNSISKEEIMDNSKAVLINNDINILRNNRNNIQLLAQQEQLELILKVLAVSIGLLFLIRYLYYAIKWSVLILKQ